MKAALFLYASLMLLTFAETFSLVYIFLCSLCIRLPATLSGTTFTCSRKRLIGQSFVSYSLQMWRRRFAGGQRQCQTWRRKEDEWSESKGDERGCWCQMGCGSESFTNCCFLVPTSQPSLASTQDGPKKRKYNVEENASSKVRGHDGQTGWRPLKGNRKHPRSALSCL